MLKHALVAAGLVLLVLGAIVCGGPKAPEPAKTEQAQPAEQAMTDQQKAEFVAANCICARCPSYVKEAAAAGEKGFCLAGKSKFITKEQGCICGQCPVTAKLGLKWGYYCTRGSAAELAAADAAKPAAPQTPPSGGK